jgi:hypothetical protein
VDEGDEDAFAAMIGKVAASETDLAALGQRARAYAAAELDKAMLTARLERVLADAVALRRERQGAAANP